MNKLVGSCACLALVGFGVAGYRYWPASLRSDQNAAAQNDAGEGKQSDERVLGSREVLRKELTSNVPKNTQSVAIAASDGVRVAPDAPALSSEQALARATARLALAKQSGELLPMDLDDIVALQRQMNDKERTVSIQQVQELLSSRDVDTSSLALPE